MNPKTQPLLCRRTDCRLCGGEHLTAVLSLTPTPPANAFVPAGQRSQAQPLFPLDLFFCEACGHVQLLDVVDPSYLFANYVYASGTSPVFVRHFERYASDILALRQPPAGALAVEIGSNDGTLLRFFQKAGLRVLGVDPARQIAAASTAAGIETLNTFFGLEVARRIRAERGPASVITANNVLAHIDDLHDVMKGVRELLEPEGLFAFEVSYLADVYEKTLFDTIYHEHLDYHTVKPLIGFLERHGLRLCEAVRVDTHGGSLRCIAQRTDGGRLVGASVAALVAEEARLGLDRPETLRAFSQKIESLKTELARLLRGLKAGGATLAGYGAPAKATTLMYHFGIGPDIIDFVVDDSPLKQGLYTPGMHIPVLSSGVLRTRRPDYLLILAWNFADAIIGNNRSFQEAGGRFIVPLPQLRVL